jgi:hypothetical protein
MMNRRKMPTRAPADWKLKVTMAPKALTVSVASSAKISTNARVLLEAEGVIEPGAPQRWVKRGDRYELALKRGVGDLQETVSGLVLVGGDLAYGFTTPVQ